MDEAAKHGFHEQALDIANRIAFLLDGIAKALDRIAEKTSSDDPELKERLEHLRGPLTDMRGRLLFGGYPPRIAQKDSRATHSDDASSDFAAPRS